MICTWCCRSEDMSYVGRCPRCRGRAVVLVELEISGLVELPCPVCSGSGDASLCVGCLLGLLPSSSSQGVGGAGVSRRLVVSRLLVQRDAEPPAQV